MSAIARRMHHHCTQRVSTKRQARGARTSRHTPHLFEARANHQHRNQEMLAPSALAEQAIQNKRLMRFRRRRRIITRITSFRRLRIALGFGNRRRIERPALTARGKRHGSQSDHDQNHERLAVRHIRHQTRRPPVARTHPAEFHRAQRVLAPPTLFFQPLSPRPRAF